MYLFISTLVDIFIVAIRIMANIDNLEIAD